MRTFGSWFVFQTVVLFPSAVLAQALPNYEIRPAAGANSPIVPDAAFVVGASWSAWKIDRVNNKVSLCSVGLLYPFPPVTPTPGSPGPITSQVAVNTTSTSAKLSPNPACTKFTTFTGNTASSAFAPAAQSSFVPFGGNDAFWSVDLTTGAVTFCLAGTGCVGLADK